MNLLFWRESKLEAELSVFMKEFRGMMPLLKKAHEVATQTNLAHLANARRGQMTLQQHAIAGYVNAEIERIGIEAVNANHAAVMLSAKELAGHLLAVKIPHPDDIKNGPDEKADRE